MPVSAFINDIPRPVWIAAMVGGFIWSWPIGLAVLAYLIGSGRISRRRCGPGRWYNMANPAAAQAPGGGSVGGAWGSWSGPWGQATQAAPAASGNKAFDEYRAETLRRLEDEQREFVDYLERLRQAKDKAEFDAFMADRRRPAIRPDAPEPG